MQIEITIDKRNKELMPKNGTELIHLELEKRLRRKYPNPEIRIRFASATDVFVLRATDSEKKNVRRIVEEMFEDANEWLLIDESDE